MIAVGMYPHGAAACGAMDMAGTLEEWCANDKMDMETVNAGTGRHIPPEILLDVGSLIAFIREMHAFCVELLHKETRTTFCAPHKALSANP